LNAKLSAAGKPEVSICAGRRGVGDRHVLESVSRGEIAYTIADDLLANIHTAYWDNLVVPVSDA